MSQVSRGFLLQRLVFARSPENTLLRTRVRSLWQVVCRLRRTIHDSVAAAVLCSWTLVLVAHAAATWALASVVASAAAIPSVQNALIARSGDAVYGRLMLALVGNIQARGVGEWLSIAFSSGSSAVGVHLVLLELDLGMVLTGVAALILLIRLRPAMPQRDWRFIFAALWSIYAAGAALRLSWSSGSGGEMVLSMIATKLVGLDGQSYDSAAQHGQVFSLALDLMLVAGAAVVGAGAAFLLGRLFRQRYRSCVRRRRQSRSRVVVLCFAALMTLIGASQKPAVAFERSNSDALPFETRAARPQGGASNLPSVVTVTPAAGGQGWEYRVNGQPEVVHGIGYNAVTTGETRDQRAARYDRDFTSMSAAGANTIAGWSESEFDDLLMQKASEHGLGVILPFHLGPTYVLSEADYAYEDPAVRQQLLEAVSRRVEQYRNSPALRMWGLGNEVLHAISWAHGSPEHAQAFSNFLVQAADRVHQLDPNHPVIYRDAEDWYVNPVIQALAANPKARPWFVYGMNFFTIRLQLALDSGPVTGLDQPLLISEFGPVGLRAEARPAGYRQLWDIIRSHRARVLGASAYVWTTAGPEPLDRNFGLTDADGQPVDGSLAELATLYQGDEPSAPDNLNTGESHR